MKLPELKPTPECSSIFAKLVKVKYWKNVLDKKEQEELKKVIGIDKLNNGLTEECKSWMEGYLKMVEDGKFVDGELF